MSEDKLTNDLMYMIGPKMTVYAQQTGKYPKKLTVDFTKMTWTNHPEQKAAVIARNLKIKWRD